MRLVIKNSIQLCLHTLVFRLSKVCGSWFLEATAFCHPQARQIHWCIFAPVTSVNAHYYSVLTTHLTWWTPTMSLLIFAPNFSLRFKIRQVTLVARFRLSQAIPYCYARSLASDLGKSTVATENGATQWKITRARVFCNLSPTHATIDELSTSLKFSFPWV